MSGKDSTLRRALAPVARLMALMALMALALGAFAPAHAGWSLSFGDEFSGGNLDRGKWNTVYPGTGLWTRTNASNDEAQVYLDDAVSVGGGRLRLTAQRRDYQWYGKIYPYTSGLITSHGKFHQTYGYFEIRARVPKGQGIWPAFWMLPSNLQWPPEIDIFEFIGHQPRTVYMTHHWDDGGPRYNTGRWDSGDFSQGYHTYAVDWSPGRLVWFVDGVERFRSHAATVPSQPFYLIANLAVGGKWPGYPDASTPFPATMDIDYIRAYKWVEGGGVAGIPQPGWKFVGQSIGSSTVLPGADLQEKEPGQSASGSSLVLWTKGAASQWVPFVSDGSYSIQVNARGDYAAGWPMMDVYVNGQLKSRVTVASSQIRTYTTQVWLPAGDHRVSVAFINDHWNAATKADRNLIVRDITLVRRP